MLHKGKRRLQARSGERGVLAGVEHKMSTLECECLGMAMLCAVGLNGSLTRTETELIFVSFPLPPHFWEFLCGRKSIG